MQPSWTVQADPNIHTVPEEQVAPRVVNERGISLNRVSGGAPRWHRAGARCERFLIPRRGQDEWLSGMPDDGEVRGSQPFLVEPGHGGGHGRQAHAASVGTFGKIAVG